jgi:hypothetical protein
MIGCHDRLPILPFSIHKAGRGSNWRRGASKLRGYVLGTAVVAVMTIAGCAANDPILTGLEGSEPERVAFGKPPDVQKQFLQKMQLCWLKKPGSPVAGSSIDSTPSTAAGASGPVPLQQITLRGSNPGAALTVEFHAFNNNNTLITTRNHGFPPAVAAALERDLENWTFSHSGCDTPDAPPAAVVSAPSNNGAVPKATEGGGKAAHAQPAHSG